MCSDLLTTVKGGFFAGPQKQILSIRSKSWTCPGPEHELLAGYRGCMCDSPMDSHVKVAQCYYSNVIQGAVGNINAGSVRWQYCLGRQMERS